MALAICAIGFLGFLVWGPHMFVSGMNPYSGLAFSLLTVSIGVPSAIKTFNWLGTLWGGRIQLRTPMLFAIGFVSFFVTGGLSGIFLAQPAVDTMLHGTYYVVAHIHLVMGVGGGIRRYADPSGAKYLLGLQPLHGFITVAAFITAAAQLIFFWNFFRSLKSGAPATANPWRATTLEWATSSPPPADNFGGKVPCVYLVPYEYSVPGESSDFLPQNFSGKQIPPSSPAGGGIPQRVYRTGVLMLLAGVAMVFMALVSAEIVRRGFSSDWQQLDLPWRIVALSTAILVASSVTLGWSRSRLRAGDEAGFRHGWLVTAILGLFFVAGVGLAWRQLLVHGIGIASNPSSSFFYVFTAAHAAHVLGGVVALAAVLIRPLRRLSRRAG